jgi:hypothetical protein
LQELIGLNLKKLKMGFKQIYGDTVYGFIWLQNGFCSKNYSTAVPNVNEVGLKIGYSTEAIL